MALTGIGQAQSPGGVTQAEQLFLEGKMTARAYQKFLDAQREQTITAALAELAAFRTNGSAGIPNVLANRSGLASPGENVGRDLISLPASAASRAKLDAIDARLADMEVRQARRGKTADLTTNTVTGESVVGSAAKTKRQQLDELLRLFAIEGKISEAEYNERRAKLMALPD